ncbi:glycolipid anchored surface protein [Xylariomycetidae sp. FL0641]|nr:glycolipid anchored surface protein [Xylariomycetidae sp. FL0641]
MAPAEIEPITVKGRYFWRGNERFLVKGVVYQLGSSRRQEGASHPPDPLAEQQLDTLQRSLPLFKELGLNTLFIYRIDASENHDTAMKLLAEAGIYVLVGLGTVYRCVNRNSPFDSYTPELLQTYFAAVDVLSQYKNTLGLIVANEVINSPQNTSAAPVIRALVRDVRRYMDLSGQIETAGFTRRKLPLGISAAETTSVLLPQYRYLCGGDDEGVLDFFSFTSYSWVGESSLVTSGYWHLVDAFKNAPLPVFFSEYGTIHRAPRIFAETDAIYSPVMTPVFSGGLVYEFLRSGNGYGLVNRDADNNLEPREDFFNLRNRLHANRGMPPASISREKQEALTRPDMPQPDGLWRADRPVPASPLDWDQVRHQLEDRQWVDLAEEEHE